MRYAKIAVGFTSLVLLGAEPSTVPTAAPPGICPALPEAASLRNLSCAEATELIGKLKQAQAELRAGKRLAFLLVSGAPALDPVTQIPPREAFLNMRFETAFIIERLKTGNKLRQPFDLAYRAEGPGHNAWKVHVDLGFYGQLERVELLFRPPPPF